MLPAGGRRLCVARGRRPHRHAALHHGEQRLQALDPGQLRLCGELRLAGGQLAAGHTVAPRQMVPRRISVTQCCRFNSLILAADGDVLTPGALVYLANLHRKVGFHYVRWWPKPVTASLGCCF